MEYITKDAAIKAVTEDDTVNAIIDIKPEEVVPLKRGRWIKSLYDFRCNRCGAYSEKKTRFCPDCGALMSE